MREALRDNVRGSISSLARIGDQRGTQARP
jgi:hypothetical protein